MSTSKKLIVALIVLLLILTGWFFMNKNMDNTGNDVIAEQPLAGAMTTTDIATGGNVTSAARSVGDKGTVTNIAVDPLLGRRGVGDPNAPVQVREYFSLTCNHCADFHKTTYQELKSKYIDTGKVYFIYEEFPLNGPALFGSMIARCMPEERYTGFVDILLRNQDSWAFSGDFRSALQQNAKLAGMSDADFEACFNNKDLQKAIANNISKASDAWEVSSTPSFVFNDGVRIFRGSKSLEDFDSVIAELMGTTTPKEASSFIEPTEIDANTSAKTMNEAAVNSIKEVTPEVVQQDIIKSTQDAVVDTAETSMDKTKEMGNAMVDAAQDAADTTSDAVSKTMDAASDALSE